MNMNKRPRISLDLLKGFEAAARHMSFTLAAKELCVTQSAVSRQVKLLEEQTGQTLFLRVNRGLLLTSAGQTLFSAVGQANALVYDAIDALADDPHTPSLLVAAAAPFATMVIAPALHGFLALSEVRNVRIQSSNEPAELERLAAHVQIRHYAPGAALAGAARRSQLQSIRPSDQRRHQRLRHCPGEACAGPTPSRQWTTGAAIWGHCG